MVTLLASSSFQPSAAPSSHPSSRPSLYGTICEEDVEVIGCEDASGESSLFCARRRQLRNAKIAFANSDADADKSTFGSCTKTHHIAIEYIADNKD